MINIDQLAAEISNAVRQYTEDVTSDIEQELDRTSKTILREIKANSPVDSGDYKKGWVCKKDTSDGQTTYTIYNKNKPFLTHLLEFGHAKRGGGRVSGRPHIRPASDTNLPSMVDRIKEIIRNGG